MPHPGNPHPQALNPTDPMIQLEPDLANALIVIRIEGKLRKEDYSELLPAVTGLIEKVEKLKFLIVLQDFRGWDAGALLEDLEWDMKYASRCGRIAVVGENRWQEWGTRLSNLFFPDEMKFFPADSETAAREWLTGTG